MAEKKIESDNETEAGDAAENEESMIGNICNLQVLPPGYYGSPEQGHLVFNASFESGNLGRVDAISEHEFDLFIRPDTCNVRYRVWLYFSVSNTRVNQRVIFNVVNFSKTKSLFREGMTPMVKSTSRPKWQKLPVKQCYYYRSPEHQKNYVLSFAFVFDIEEVYEFSYCYPYTYTDLQDYLDVIEEQDLPFFKRELLGVTVQQRRLDLLTITRPSNFDDDVMKRVVFISARVHPGETPASYMCQGLIDFLISHNELADVLRKYLVFKIVPMLNPDGVYLGNYRCSLMGYDLNRYWSDPSAWAHPALYTTKQYLTALGQNENVQLDFFIDLHAHSTLLNAFMFGNAFDDSGRMEKQSVFPRLMSVNVEDFSLSNTNFNNDELKSGTGRRCMAMELGVNTLCYTLEVSFFGWTAKNTTAIIPYTTDAYIKLGRNLARTFAHYYTLCGVIGGVAVPPIPSRPSAHRDVIKASRTTLPLKSPKLRTPRGTGVVDATQSFAYKQARHAYGKGGATGEQECGARQGRARSRRTADSSAPSPALMMDKFGQMSISGVNAPRQPRGTPRMTL